MKKVLKVEVDRPCGEDWQQFPKTQDGFTLSGHCASCNKHVIDFTSWSEDRIRDYFLAKPTDVCGRFISSQLTDYPIDKKPQQTYTSLFSLVLSALLVFSSRLAEAQSHKEKKVEIAMYANQGKENNNENRSIIVKGKVVATEDGESLPSVNVVQRTTTNGTVTNADGTFSIALENPKELETLVFSFIGMKVVELEINPNEGKWLDVQMSQDVATLGIVITGGIGYRILSPRRWWWRIKGLFKRI